MGFTALDGLPMGTRPGQLDPGVVLHLIAQKGMSAAAVQRSPLPRLRPQGPLGHLATTCATCWRATIRARRFAIDHFVYRCGLARRPACGRARRPRRLRLHRRHRRELRRDPRPHRRAARLARRRARPGRQRGAARSVISTPASRVALLVIPTDEELMIARHTLALVGA